MSPLALRAGQAGSDSRRCGSGDFHRTCAVPQAVSTFERNISKAMTASASMGAPESPYKAAKTWPRRASVKTAVNGGLELGDTLSLTANASRRETAAIGFWQISAQALTVVRPTRT